MSGAADPGLRAADFKLRELESVQGGVQRPGQQDGLRHGSNGKIGAGWVGTARLPGEGRGGKASRGGAQHDGDVEVDGWGERKH